MTANEFWHIAYYAVMILIAAACAYSGLWVVYNEVREWVATRKEPKTTNVAQ